ncbi:hypothetical protein SRABI98_01565 [Microbacterium sp. Bi98]|nr:hypothetical protein SRABI98_01565 [Microbacterium sp. Bi98]
MVTSGYANEAPSDDGASFGDQSEISALRP